MWIQERSVLQTCFGPRLGCNGKLCSKRRSVNLDREDACARPAGARMGGGTGGRRIHKCRSMWTSPHRRMNSRTDDAQRAGSRPKARRAQVCLEPLPTSHERGNHSQYLGRELHRCGTTAGKVCPRAATPLLYPGGEAVLEGEPLQRLSARTRMRGREGSLRQPGPKS